MNTKNLIYKFVAQLCEKQYAYANSTLATILEAKIKEKIKKEVAKNSMKAKSKKTKAKNPKMGSKKTK